VCSLLFSFFIFGISVSLVLWGMFTDLEAAKRRRILSVVPLVGGWAKWAWDWGARTSWEILFSVGWLGLVEINEYAGGLFCLAFFAFGMFSRLMHSTKAGSVLKITGSVVIVLGFFTLFTTTLANKGSKPWSPTLNLVDAKLADRIPIPGAPVFPSKLSIPSAPAITRVSPATWIDLRSQISTKVAPQRQPAIEARPDAKVDVALVVGDDDATSARMVADIGNSIPQFQCVTPFVCFKESDLSNQWITLDVTKQKKKRVLWAVANVSDATVSKPTVIVELDASVSGFPNDVTIAAMPGAIAGPHNGKAIEFAPPNTNDILPYKRSSSPIDFGADIIVGDNPTTDFRVIFRIYAENLTVHIVMANIHLVTK
jgi:hypothetical protein